MSDTDDVMVEQFAHLLKPFHFLFPKQETARAAQCIVKAIETPANFLIGIPDLLGLDNVFFVLADWLVPTV